MLSNCLASRLRVHEGSRGSVDNSTSKISDVFSRAKRAGLWVVRFVIEDCGVTVLMFRSSGLISWGLEKSNSLHPKPWTPYPGPETLHPKPKRRTLDPSSETPRP